jgi:hypothetical protein
MKKQIVNCKSCRYYKPFYQWRETPMGSTIEGRWGKCSKCGIPVFAMELCDDHKLKVEKT